MTTTGIWNEEEANHHIMSDDLAMKLQVLIDPDNCVIDIGCGRGDYLRNLTDENYTHCVGVEGTRLSEHGGMDIRYHDLSEPLYLDIKGQVLSFEVGEHIPVEYEATFLDTLVRHCNSILILSWGLPGQDGIGHVNCQPQFYIIEEIERRGLVYSPVETEFIREASYLDTPWFKETLMVFRW